jgi:hypothetical protein
MFVVQKQIVLGQNIFNGNMTAQWNGKLRNVQVFDRAFTDVGLSSIFIPKCEDLIVHRSGRDYCRVKTD